MDTYTNCYAIALGFLDNDTPHKTQAAILTKHIRTRVLWLLDGKFSRGDLEKRSSELDARHKKLKAYHGIGRGIE